MTRRELMRGDHAKPGLGRERLFDTQPLEKGITKTNKLSVVLAKQFESTKRSNAEVGSLI